MSANSDDQLTANLQELQRRYGGRPAPPPLRIHHLMACAAVAAVQLSLWRFAFSRASEQQTLFGVFVFSFGNVLTAVGLTLAGFSIYWWRKGYASLSEPGQMLLLTYAASILQFLGSVVFAVVMSSVSGGPRSARMLQLLPMLVGISSLVFGILLPIVFYIWCAWKIADTWPWRMLFIFSSLSAMVTSGLAVMLLQMMIGGGPANIRAIFGIPHLIRGTVLLAIGGLAIFSDLATKRERSWTHWAGAALWMLGQIGMILTEVFYLFVWRLV
jgi:hypothetical protein